MPCCWRCWPGRTATIRGQINVKTHPYTKALKDDIKGMKIGLVTEGFAQPNAEADVNAKVKAAAKKFEALGATVGEVSIPLHLAAGALWMPIGTEGLTQTMMWGDGYGVSRPDLYVTSLMDFHRNWRNRANEMSETTKLFTMLGTYIRRYYGSRYYGKAMNQTRLFDGGLRRSAGRVRPADDADHADQGDALAAARGAARELQVERGARHDLQHCAVSTSPITRPWPCPAEWPTACRCR